MMATSKDLKGLANDIRALEGLTRIAGKRVAPKIAGLIDEQFERGVDPSGNPWEPLAEATLRKGRTPPPLTDTGEMRASVKVVAKGNDLVASVDDPSRFHQGRRPILPTDEIPKTWTDAIEKTVDEVAKTFPIYSRADK